MKKILPFLILAAFLLLPKPLFAQSCPQDHENYSNQYMLDNCSIAEIANLPETRIMTFSSEIITQISSNRLQQFTNDDLIKIGQATGNLISFLNRFSNNRLLNPSFSYDILKQLPEERIKTFSCEIQQQLGYACPSTTPSPTRRPTPSPSPSPSPVSTNTPLPSTSPESSPSSSPKKPVKIIISQFEREDQILDPFINLNEAKINLNFDSSGIANVRFQVNYDSSGQDNVVYFVQYKLKKIFDSPDESGVTPLTSCQEITESGNYVLDQDLTTTSKSCLNIHDVDNVNLNCNYHTITLNLSSNDYNLGRVGPIINIKNVNKFTIDSCKVITPTNITKFPIIGTINILNSSDGKVINNVIGPHHVYIFESNNIQIIKNQFNDYFGLVSSKNILIDNNTLKPKGIMPNVISVNGGGQNTFSNNSIDGDSDGIYYGSNSPNNIGADDGIAINDSEGGDIISNNTISNNWDCAIETEGTIKSMKIIGNRLINSGVCGIGAWYYNSWIGNVISDNIIDNTPLMFDIYRQRGLKSGENAVYFQDNTFDNNKFINPRHRSDSTDITPVRIYMLPQDGIAAEKFVLGNNKMANNDFGSSTIAPYLQPASMFIDGGGNKCAKSAFSDFPLKCSGISTSKSPEPSPTSQPIPTSTPAPLKLIDFNNDEVINVFDYIEYGKKKVGL